MVITEEPINDVVVIERVVGRFDQSARQDFKWRIDVAAKAGRQVMILDLTSVSFIDSAVLGWLILLQRRFQKSDRKLSIVAGHGVVRELLDLVNITEWIPVFVSEEDAVASAINEVAA